MAPRLFSPDMAKDFGDPLPPGSGVAPRCRITRHLAAFSDDNEDVGGDIFYIADDKILLKYPMMPAMLTLDENVIRQDCLCYMMERMTLPDVK